MTDLIQICDQVIELQSDRSFRAGIKQQSLLASHGVDLARAYKALLCAAEASHAGRIAAEQRADAAERRLSELRAHSRSMEE